jgi:GxxExxY protein
VQDPQTYQLIGAAMEVHRELGCGFLERVYHEALAQEFTAREIHYRREAALPVIYKGLTLEASYFADFVCFDAVILEIKAVNSLDGKHQAQVLNYLKASGYRTGLLLNFGDNSLEYRRLVL